jgi:hypothetical protein
MTARRIVAALWCAWVLWGAEGGAWAKIATVGSRAECVHVRDTRARATAPAAAPVTYRCLPDGEDPAER